MSEYNDDVCTLCGLSDAKTDYDREFAQVLEESEFAAPGLVCRGCFQMLCEASDTTNPWLVAREFLQQRDLARDVATALEQENADLLRQVEEAATAVRFLALRLPDPGDVVGSEDVPVGDPWAELGDGPWSDDG